MATPVPKVGDTVLTACSGPCRGPQPHVVIQPVSRGRTYAACRQCDSVTSVPHDQLEKQHG